MSKYDSDRAMMYNITGVESLWSFLFWLHFNVDFHSLMVVMTSTTTTMMIMIFDDSRPISTALWLT